MTTAAAPSIEDIDRLFERCQFVVGVHPEYLKVPGQGVFAIEYFHRTFLNQSESEIFSLLRRLPAYSDPRSPRISFLTACCSLELDDEQARFCEIEKLIQLGTALEFLEFIPSLPLDRQIEISELGEVELELKEEIPIAVRSLSNNLQSQRRD